MNAWESVFTQSRVNDGFDGEQGLPEQAWQWPKTTWFRVRLEKVREQEPTAFVRSPKRSAIKGAPELN